MDRRAVATEGLSRFDELAAGYDSWFSSRLGAFVERREKALLRRLVEPSEGLRVLEVGSGTGYFLRHLAQSGAECIGLEPSGPMLAVAFERDGGHVQYVRGRAEELPFEDAVFDVVAYITTLEFVADVESALREGMRACRTGGRLVFVVLNGRGPWYRQRQAQGGLWRETRFFTVEELQALLAHLGSVEIEHIVHVPPSLGWLPVWAMNAIDLLLRVVSRGDGALIGAKVRLNS